MATNYEPNGPFCAHVQESAKNAHCCNHENRPHPCEMYVHPQFQRAGEHGAFDLCRDGDYPSGTSMVINFLYIGEGSCAQYYQYAREGRIVDHMHDVVRFFAYEPCGCGEFNTVMQECMEYLEDNPQEPAPTWMQDLIRSHPQSSAPDWMVERMPEGMLDQIRPGWVD